MFNIMTGNAIKKIAYILMFIEILRCRISSIRGIIARADNSILV